MFTMLGPHAFDINLLCVEPHAFDINLLCVVLSFIISSHALYRKKRSVKSSDSYMFLSACHFDSLNRLTEFSLD